MTRRRRPGLALAGMALVACSWGQPTEAGDPGASSTTEGAEDAELSGPAAGAASESHGSAASSAPRRPVVAIGDVHGDLQATRRALRLAGVIDDEDTWVGGRTLVVQLGDQLDRGDGERAILDLFATLSDQARAAGGAFVPLLGNHEVMNASGDFRYVTPGGWAAFADVPHDPADPALADLRPEVRGRVAALSPGGMYAQRLASHPVVYVDEGLVFVHGGVLPTHVRHGIGRLNGETAAWLRGQGPMPDLLRGPDAPIWTRRLSRDTGPDDCAALGEVLQALDAEAMLVAHTPQRGGMTSACDGRVWRVDVGLAAHYGGPVQVWTRDATGTIRVRTAEEGAGAAEEEAGMGRAPSGG